MKPKVHNLIIIGSGPAGLTAGIYAARANLQPVIIDGATPGGQLMGTSYIENWPGEQRILGPELMQRMRDHAAHYGCTFVSGKVTSVNFKNSPFEITINEEQQLNAQSVIVASGTLSRRLGVPGEDTYWGKGVSTCAVCDGVFYAKKPVIIVGGGDSAMEEASFMTKFTDKITIIQILDKLTASHVMQKRILDDKRITILYSTTVTEIRGDNKQVTALVAVDQKTKKETVLPTNAVFVAIGLIPNTKVFERQLELLENGYVKIDNTTHTSVPGIFAAGDIADFKYRQAITAAGTGCMAALDAERYLASLADVKNRLADKTT